MLVMLLLVLLVTAGVFAGVIVLLRARPDAGRLEANAMVPRVSGEVRAGEEQVLIHLARSLHVASGRSDVGYGEVYIAGSAGSTMRLASRSEIGRGFDGEVRVHRTRRASVVGYYILRLPADETLHERITRLDDEIARALRSLDPTARVQISGGRRRPVLPDSGVWQRRQSQLH